MSERLKFRYITNAQFERLLAEINLDSNLSEDAKRDIYEEAVGQFESDMAERFVVPLTTASGAEIIEAKDYTRLMVQNAIKAKIRQVVGLEQSRNVVIDNNQKYIDVHGIKYNRNKKILLNFKIPFDLKLQEFAEDAKTPIQTVGIARASNDFSTIFEPSDF